MGWRYLTACGLAAWSRALAAAPATAAKPRFASAPKARIVTKRLFDIGVADPDRNGRQDIFTTNHKFRSVFLRNRKGRSFQNVINRIGLGPDDRYPGLELLRPPADVSAPGIYIWPSDEPGDAGQLHLESSGLTVSGRVRLMTKRLAIRSQTAATAAVGRDVNNRPFIDFTIQPGGEVSFASNGLADLPIQFEFAESGPGAVTSDEIKVGADAVSPDAPLFQIKLRDRHALAFAESPATATRTSSWRPAVSAAASPRPGSSATSRISCWSRTPVLPVATRTRSAPAASSRGSVGAAPPPTPTPTAAATSTC